MATERPKDCDCALGFDPSTMQPEESTAIEMIVDREPDYTEHYLVLAYDESDFGGDLKPNESIRSLPEVQVETDRCEGRIEIPWLDFSLPPPGTLEIVSKKEKPFRKKGPCQCWRNKKDVIEQDLSAQVQVPDDMGACKCTNTEKEAIRSRLKTEAVPEEFIEGEEAGVGGEEEIAEDEEGAPQEEEEDLGEGEGEEGEEGEGEEEEAAPSVVKEEDEYTPFKKCECFAQGDCSFQALRMTYDNPCFANHEPYVDIWYNYFPDDCDTECGPYTEIPWDEIVIPRNIKIKASIRKQTKGCNTQICPNKQGDIDQFDENDPNSRALVKVDKNEMVPCPKREQATEVSPQKTATTCACFETGKKSKKNKKSERNQKENNNLSKGAQIMQALYDCQADMEPIKSALTELKSKVSFLRQMKSNAENTKSKSDHFKSEFSSNPTCICSCLLPPLPPFPPPPFPMSPFLPQPPPSMLQNIQSNETKSPIGPCTYKCKRNKTTKKDSSSTSDSLKIKKKKKSKREEGSTTSKRCKCPNRLAEKMTNTRRRECVKSCKMFNNNNETYDGDKVYESCPTATSGGVIIEECQ